MQRSFPSFGRLNCGPRERAKQKTRDNMPIQLVDLFASTGPFAVIIMAALGVIVRT